RANRPVEILHAPLRRIGAARVARGVGDVCGGTELLERAAASDRGITAVANEARRLELQVIVDLFAQLAVAARREEIRRALAECIEPRHVRPPPRRRAARDPPRRSRAATTRLRR